MSNKSGDTQQIISLPKGGGALKGIGETFQPNLFSGTGNYSIPIAVSPGRNGFGPTLSLQYSSGNGNGPFGLGWQLSIPRITRKTEKGLPRYDDSDVFVMSGAEDLVPLLKRVIDPINGDETWIPEDPIARLSHTVFRYRPRTEGIFARIERWENTITGDVHWRSITRDNVTSIYGATSSARITDPENDRRVYEWFLEETLDATGNHIRYEYARDNPQLYSNEDPAFGLDAIFEQNRRASQVYVRRIYYGNFPEPLLKDNGNALTYADGTAIGHLREGLRYAFEIVFDYGDWEIPTKDPHPKPDSSGLQELFGPSGPAAAELNPVPIRGDCFSNFRARFEVRTLRRCRRVLMFHHFRELGGPTLIQATNFDYENDPDTRLSLLSAVTVNRHRRNASRAYESAGFPPVSFKYSEFKPHEQRFQSVLAEGNDMPPVALNDRNVALVDLFGDGLLDVLHSGPFGFRYWRNLGAGRLDRPRSLPQIPAGIALAQAGVGFGDMGGDGQPDLLVHSGPLPGFFETTSDGTWKTFKPYDDFPSFDLADPDVRLVDLTGDGLSDALMTEGDRFLWFECLGEKGFGPPQAIARKRDLDQFPDIFFSDPGGRVRLADLTGDGLNDIVLIHNGRIEYWPNLGYGQFGKRITMENAPHLELDFNPKRLFLADLNGTGCADLVYVDFDRVYFWFNQSGNRWSDTQTISGTPIVTDVDAIQFADVFGTGTATLVWSYRFLAQPEGNYKALDFCGGVKPYVLTEMSNNLGSTTRLKYAPSTRYFLEDQAQGTPWITKLPFPIQVVDKVEVIDHVSRTKLVTTFKYHHGYFDGREREFRGFGRVDQFDTETFEDFSGSGLHGGSGLFDNNSAAFHVPVVETRSWFHTGIYFDEDSTANVIGALDFRELTNRYRQEFYAADEEALVLGEHDVETGDTPFEAYRALRGALLRQEVYARDGTARAPHPYTVIEGRHLAKQLQPKNGNHHAVYFSHELETFNYNYERNPTDPRLLQTLALEVDAFGNPRRSVAIAYGRRRPDPSLPTEADREQQSQALIAYTESRFTNEIDDPLLDAENYRTPLPSETRNYELTGFKPANGELVFILDEWVKDDFARLDQAVEIEYEEIADLAREQKRVIEQVCIRYRSNDLQRLLPLGVLESLALPGESYKLAFTRGLLDKVFVRNGQPLLPVDPAKVLEGGGPDRGGYVDLNDDDNWWIPSGRFFFSPNAGHSPAQELTFARQHFFCKHRSRDPFGNTAVMSYDAYDLLVEQTNDPLGNIVVAESDYRVLQPFRVTDPNGNRMEVAFDILGLVGGSALKGKTTETKGDSLEGFFPDLTQQQRQDFFTDPLGQAELLLGQATTRIVYDLDRFVATGQPNFAATLSRETHVADLSPTETLKVQISISYSDGFGREVQKKLRAEPGPLIDDGPVVEPRWVASGWTIFNNKGKPVQQYEPFFDGTHDFRFARKIGVSSTLFYDPLQRVVSILHADHSWEKVVFNPWRQESWDVNDTALISDPRTDPDAGEFYQRLDETDYLPTWHEQRRGGALGPEEQAAASKTAIHAATPSVGHADSLGRTFLTLAHNRFERNGAVVEETIATRGILDIEGNQRQVLDAKDRVVMRYDYDLLSTRIHQASMEAGERWMLNDVAGKPLVSWDSRARQFRNSYDQLRRPTDAFLKIDDEPEILLGHTVYGESRPDPEINNLRGKVVQLFDQAGIATSEVYDFKNNLLVSRRQLATEYQNTLDWSGSPALEPEVFTSRTTYDALNRPISVIAPDGSLYHPTFNQANLLEQVEVILRGEPETTIFVDNIDYDAKGRRVLIEYGNGVRTTYQYDPMTFRLAHMQTLRGHARLQDLSYTYDPIGNITHIRDQAQQTIYFDSQAITASNEYGYDALYRLIEAQGREHIGQTSEPQTTFDDRFRVHLPHPGDGQAMRRYAEAYEYDALGNFLHLIHRAVNGNWTRTYTYNEPSLIEPTKQNNRLSGTGDGDTINEFYAYDEQGNMVSMPHLAQLDWDFGDHLQHVDLGGGGDAFYVYDASGQRMRKVLEKNNGSLIEERIYLGGFEIFRRRNSAGAVTLERQTLHIMDDKQRVALVETRTVGNDGSAAQLIRFQFSNHLGSASLELNDQAQIISYEEYYPYGSTSYQAGSDIAEAPLKRYRYIGMERDEETGLSYHRARYYAPWLGRWLSPDPLSFKHWDFSTYAYSALNPIRFIDTSGLEPDETSGEKPAQGENVTAPQQALMREVDEWTAFIKKYPTEEKMMARYNQLMKAAEDRWINNLTHGLDGNDANLIRIKEEGIARNLREDWHARQVAGTKLLERVRDSSLPAGTDVNYRQTPWKDVLHDRLIAAGATPPPKGGGGIEPEGGIGGFFRGLKNLFSKRSDSGGGPPSLPEGNSERFSLSYAGERSFAGPAFNGVFGAFTIYNGVEDTGTVCRITQVSGGSLMLGGALVEGFGLIRNSSSLMSVGGSLSFAGQIVVAPVIAYHAWQDINSGDPARALTGSIDMSSIGVPALAGISLYIKVVAPPAAEAASNVFHSATSSDMGQITGFAGASWSW